MWTFGLFILFWGIATFIVIFLWIFVSLSSGWHSVVTGLMKNMQPDPRSNRGPSAYRANALLIELPDHLHIIHSVLVLTQVTAATLF